MNEHQAQRGGDGDEAFILPGESTLLIAGWAKWLLIVAAPPLAALFTWAGWDIVRERLTGKGWENLWFLAFMLATLAALVLLMLSGLVLVLRARLTVNHQGMVLRGIFRTRSLTWDKLEGYRWNNNQLFVYPVDDQWPMNLSHFENLGLLGTWLYCHLQNLPAVELAREAREIHDDHEPGLSEEEKAARLGRLRRIVKTVNWIAYIAGAVGALNGLFLDQPVVQLVTASALIPVPVVLVLFALRDRNYVRLDYKEGSQYPEGLTGILASSLGLGMMSLLDHHTVLGERLHQWTFALALLSAGIWLQLEWQRIREQRRVLLIALHVFSVFFLSAFWAGGAIYQVNKNADVSEPAWAKTLVTRLRESKERTGTSYHAEVAPWSGSSAERVELDVSRATYDTLHVGAKVEISVRRGALEIPWVDEVKLKRAN